MTERFMRVTVSKLPACLGRSGLSALAFAGVLTLAPLVAVAQTEAPKPAQTAPKPAAAAPKPAAPAATPAKPSAATPAPTPAKPAETAAEPDPLPWTKLCSKDQDQKKVCLVVKEIRSAEGQLIASVALRDIEGDPKKVLLIAVPPVVLIQPGMRVSVDNGKQDEAKFTICFPNACYGELTVSDQMNADFRKGQALVVKAINIQQKPMQFSFGMSTFKAAIDSVGIDPTAGQQSQEQLQQQLQKKAEEAAKKLSGDAPKP